MIDDERITLLSLKYRIETHFSVTIFATDDEVMAFLYDPNNFKEISPLLSWKLSWHRRDIPYSMSALGNQILVYRDDSLI
jgi:hypothetical protein